MEEEFRICTHCVLALEARWNVERAWGETLGDLERICLIEKVRIDEKVLNTAPREIQISLSRSEVDILMTCIKSDGMSHSDIILF